MEPAEAPTHAITVLRNRIQKLVTDHYVTIENNTIAWYNDLANKYAVPLHEHETQRDNAAARLEYYLRDLGYV